ncbi:MAG: hypothetical protein A2096_07500 [Spirochaetes bacterium GWF1_41_5]|nr:MAG: hypothetical protein A2096_07500 [Spirochaetes bacterium GWF1_41_5]HBE01928.1 hypothetical protein [Spirochaetia bacterium]
MVYNYTWRFYHISNEVMRFSFTGMLGAFAGFLIAEMIIRYTAGKTGMSAQLLNLFGVFGIMGALIGAFLGGAQGYYTKNRFRMISGSKTGGIFGLFGGMISGLIANFLYGFILSNMQSPGLFQQMAARTAGWAVFGMLLGAAYGIKENTVGDLKTGLMSGFIGGAIAGLLFDPISMIMSAGGGAFSRAAGFVILGAALGFSIKFFQEKAEESGSSEMFQRLTYRLPENVRLDYKQP